MMARKRKSEMSYRSGGKKIQRNAANARERARMRVLSKAFTKLKTSLPWVPSDTKLSKLDTLRLAASYISHLRQILTEDTSQTSIHPITLTWPFLSRPPHQQETPSIGECENNENCDSPAEFDDVTSSYRVMQCYNYQTYNTVQQEFDLSSHFL